MKRNLNQKINIWVKRAVGIYLTAALMIAVPTYADVIPPAPGPAAVAQNPGTAVQNPGTAVQNPGAAAQNPGGAALQDPTSTAEESYLGGAELTLLAPATQSQNLSCVIQTKAGSLIVVDGGLREDAPHLIETIKAKGGRVSAWLITHPHSDHIGALTEILNTQPIPVEIDNIIREASIWAGWTTSITCWRPLITWRPKSFTPQSIRGSRFRWMKSQLT